jgi:hypothetical protein
MPDVIKKEYKIGEKVYFQLPLKMGQVSQIIGLLKDVNLPNEITALSIISVLGDKLSQAIAIVLHDPEVSLKDKNIKQFASDLEFEISPEVALEVVEDFFDITPISLLLGRVGKTVEKITEKMKKETGSTP